MIYISIHLLFVWCFNYLSGSHLQRLRINWDSAECITHSTNYQQRLTLESWHTNSEQEPLNRCQQLPAPYKRLIHDLKLNRQTNNKWIKNNSNSNWLITTTFTFWWSITSRQNWPIRTKTRDMNTIMHLMTTHLALKMTRPLR